jgi:hypothetical protein
MRSWVDGSNKVSAVRGNSDGGFGWLSNSRAHDAGWELTFGPLARWDIACCRL